MLVVIIFRRLQIEFTQDRISLQPEQFSFLSKMQGDTPIPEKGIGKPPREQILLKNYYGFSQCMII